MGYKNWLLGIGLGILLAAAACRQENSAETHPAAEDAATSDEAPAGQYYHLTGSLDDLAITMELREESRTIAYRERSFRGFYRYDDYGGPIAVYGTLGEDDRLILNEEGSWEGIPHRFEGRWSPTGTYEGLWRHQNERIVHDFRLKAAPRAVPLTPRRLEDSLVVYPQWPSSPVVYHSLDWLDVAPELDAAQSTFLRAQIYRGLLGEKAGSDGEPDRFQQAVARERQTVYDEFREEMEGMREARLIDSLADPDQFLSFHYSYETSMQVYYNTPELLTVGYTDYAYTGGAHGMYNTRVETYDLNNRRVLQLTDVLRSGYVDAVSTALERAVRLKYNLGDRSPLSTFLFDDEIAPNDNYGFTDKGVFFVYAPYEIAPYAAGEIELFVSFEQIVTYVEEGWGE